MSLCGATPRTALDPLLLGPDVTIDPTNAAQARRSKLILLATVSSSASRFVSIGTNLLQVPLALHFLGAEAFGLWMTVVGTMQLMSFADLGLGLGLQNKISTAHGADDVVEIRSLHHTGMRVLVLIGAIVILVCWPLCWLLPWGSMFNVADAGLRTQLPYALMAVVTSFAIGLPLSAGTRLATGLQLGWVTGVSTIFSSTVTLVVVAVAGYLRLPFAAFVGATVVPPLLANLGVGLKALRTLPDLPQSQQPQFRRDIMGDIIRQGMLFLVPQASASFMVAAPNLFIASALGPLAVTPFSIGQRLANLSLQMLQLPLAPLWPAYAEARSRGDTAWIYRTLEKSLLFSGLGGLAAGAGIVLLGRPILLLWTGKPEAVPGTGVLLGFGMWVAVVGLFSSVVIFLNGSGRLRGQALGGVVSSVLLGVSLPPLISHFSTAGAVFAMLGSWLLGSVPLVCMDLRSTVSKPAQSTRAKASSDT